MILQKLNRRIETENNNYRYYRKNKGSLLISGSEFRRLKKFEKNYLGLNSTLFNGKKVSFNSPFWFLHSIDELFIEEVYKFNAENDSPVIIDCGANIGLSVLYFKKLYPKSQITAIEADPFVYNILKSNLAEAGRSDVDLINAAVWFREEVLTFKSEGSVGGKIDLNDSGTNMISVPGLRLRNLLAEPVDFLKMDIEGAEYDVLKDCQDLLVNVKNLFIEYHVQPNEEQHLHEILDWVNKAGFKYYIKEAWNNMSYPFMKTYNDYFQMQLNISCYR